MHWSVGYPQAHEDDSRRAVLAARQLTEKVAEISGSRSLAARVGVATGLVVVGDLIGDGASQENAVVGQTPNLAARLQSLASPGGVVISALTRQLVGDRGRFKSLEAMQLKGFSSPIDAFEVIEFDAGAGGPVTEQASEDLPMVGRDVELALLERRWQEAGLGAGQVVLLCAEPGAGKSRLVSALERRAAETPHRVIRCYCSPYHKQTALHPIVPGLQRALGIGERVDVSASRALDTTLSTLSWPEAGGAALVRSALGLSPSPESTTESLEAGELRRRQLDALGALLSGLSIELPVLLIV